MNGVATEIVSQAQSAIPPQIEGLDSKEAVTETVEAPKPELASPKLSTVALKERDLVRKQQEFKREMEAFRKERQEWERRMQEVTEKERLWKESPEKALETYGHSYQSLTERMLSGGEVTTKELEKKFKDELSTFKKSIEDEKREKEEAEQKRKQEEAEQTIASYKDDLRGFVAQKKDEFKLVNLFDKDAELIYDIIDENYKQHAKILSHEEAAGLAEKYFKDLWEKASAVLTPAQHAAADKVMDGKDTTPQAPKAPAKTLTNEMHSTTPSMLPAKTENDRMRRAMAALEGKA